MLVNVDNGRPREIYQVMLKAPISWGQIIVLDNIHNTMTLYAKITQHELALVHAARLEASNITPVDNLLTHLKKLGCLTEQKPNFPS
jgi:hypothetical protein